MSMTLEMFVDRYIGSSHQDYYSTDVLLIFKVLMVELVSVLVAGQCPMICGKLEVIVSELYWCI